MKFSRFFFLFALSLALFPLPAKADVVLGETCDTIGASMMTSDQQDIATCLKDTSGKLIWKGMTRSAANGNLCGIALVGYSKSSKKYYPSYSISTLQPCEGKTVVSPVYGTPGVATSVKADCPTGFELRGFTYASGSTYQDGCDGNCGTTTTTSSSVYYCAAQ